MRGKSMRSFKSLTEQEILALAISLEEEDARIYDDFAEGLKDSHPAQAEQFRQMRADEDDHRHRLLDLYRQKFGDLAEEERKHARAAEDISVPAADEEAAARHRLFVLQVIQPGLAGLM